MNAEDSSIEKLVGAAIVWNGKTYSSYSHSAVMDEIRNDLFDREKSKIFFAADRENKIQKGFSTTKNRFVNRTEAIKIAKAADQLSEGHENACSLESYMVKKWA